MVHNRHQPRTGQQRSAQRVAGGPPGPFGHTRPIASSTPELRVALLVFAGFVAVHLLLLMGTFDAVDLEEMEYGNVAVAMLDGQVAAAGYAALRTDPGAGDQLMTGAGRRRRATWSVEPTVTPFFALFGATMLSLKLWAICASALWAVLWFLVACRLAPRAGPWIPAMLLVLPLPLVQRSVLSATSITAHLGTSAWYAAALLLLLWARDRGRGPALALVAGSGLVAGLGLHCSFSLAPLLLGVLWLAWRQTGWTALPAWGLGALPGLALLWLFRDPSRASHGLVTGLTGLSEGSAFREPGLGGVLRNLGRTFIYGPGYGRVDPETLDLQYLPIALVFSVLLLVVVLVGWRLGRRGVEAGPRELAISLALSAGAFYAVFLVTGFKLDTGFFDGLRYLLPISALPALATTWALARLEGRRRWGLAGALVAAQAVGFVLLFRPSVFPAPWIAIQGYESPVMKAWMTGPLESSGVAPSRVDRWALWAGLSDARRADEPLSWEDGSARADRHSLPEATRAEYWRGFGVGLLLRQAQRAEGVYSLPGSPQDVGAWIWEGAAMGTAYAGCSERLREGLLRDAPAELAGSLWYGLGRADVYCRIFRDARERVERPGDFDRGYMDGWRRDWWSGRGEELGRGFVEGVRLY